MLKAILCLCGFVMMQLLSGIIALEFNEADLTAPEHLNIVTLISTQTLLSLSLCAGLVMTGVADGSLLRRPRPTNRRDAAAIAACLIAAFGINFLVSPFGLSDNGMLETFQAISSNTFGLLLLCIVGPVTEEVVFRAGIQHQLTRAGLHPLLAAGTAALTFAIVHGNAAQGVPAAALGFLLGYLYYRSGSLRLSIIAHVMNNTVAVALMHLPELEQSITALSPPIVMGTGGLLLAAAIGLIAVWQCGIKAENTDKTA